MIEEAQQIALVTGGGQGIGAGISAELARAGYHVVINDLDESRVAATVAEIASDGGSASYALADVSDSSSVDAMFDRVEAEYGSVSVLVNNAGVNGNAGIRNVSDALWDRVTSIDLDGVLHCTRRALGPMREAGTGSVINFASRAWLGWWGQSAYAAAKAGVVGMTRALAVEMASKGVRLNVVAPGLIDSPMLRDRDEEALRRLLTSVPSGTLGTPQDIANAVLFLAGERSRSMTGQVLYVCGGKSIYAYPDWS
ncbi:MAG TPA: SDR family NAD(P)-dependent oxidoreductase [Galbitalea sp.]|nr:SDR family NAD(P)-dependent oxidoreductase [Galbitalea sp.]